MSQKTPQNIKSGNKNILILILILLIILLTYLIGFYFGKDSVKLPKCKKIEQKQQIKFENFKFKIPNEYNYEISKENLIIFSKDKSWYAIINIVNKDYEQLNKNKEKIKENLSQKDIKTEKITEQTSAGTTYLTTEITYSDNKAILALSNLSTDFIAATTITTKNNKINYNILKSISPVIKSAVYYGDTISKEINKLNRTDINDSLLKVDNN